ncbi:tRNA (adenosine(37)-N6)-threonylcarbamoyltransferase complex transferase subunit TsaD [Deinococcus cellulosilyticus]|uniref:tRNA (adenosine(37)-N6)-threonylcarbamoyltransferase complex transferase subunit TsaD n=1 Tax=Deinococcus cellulosilyticus TaxID=401558 RepID=UPI0024828F94|nr:tRNA (adenosine(37)-N6)-threonylcarbamoyltransferase complex transferase subunit TsaD [Deinococcus cellulosilyticus]
MPLSSPFQGRYILGIDTSCDDTGVGIVRLQGDRPEVLANALWSQKVHRQYGGVMPEVASREHVERIDAILEDALAQAGIQLSEVTAVAATRGPGLVGALLVGLTYGKGLAQGLGVPFYAMHHLEGHIQAAVSEHPDLPFPHLALVVSGGHTHLFKVNAPGQYELVGATRDDAAGEAFDKVARMLGLGYPGGPAISKAAERGDPKGVDLPRPLLGQKGFDFSFSGIKTACLLAVKAGVNPDDLAASFQYRVVESLVQTTKRAAKALSIEHVVVSGGVAANQALRAAFGQSGLKSHFPPMHLNTDNGAMIALAAVKQVLLGEVGTDWEAEAEAYLPLVQPLADGQNRT